MGQRKPVFFKTCIHNLHSAWNHSNNTMVTDDANVSTSNGINHEYFY